MQILNLTNHQLLNGNICVAPKGHTQSVNSLDRPKLCVFTRMTALKKLLLFHMAVPLWFSTLVMVLLLAS